MGLEEGGALTASSTLTLVPSHATLNDTKNATYTELIASTSAETYRVHVVSGNPNTKGYRLWLATGAVSSEVDFANFIFWMRSPGNIAYFSFPFTIASGSRVSASCSVTTSAPESLPTQIWLSDNSDDFATCTESETWGADGTEGAVGTDLDPGTTANTKGSYTELIASTGIDANQLHVHVGVSEIGTISPSGDHLIDFAVGPVDSEVIIIPDLYHDHPSSEDGVSQFLLDVDNIPSGSRISARCQSTYTTESDRIIDVAITAFNVAGA